MDHNNWMYQALTLAYQAQQSGEVPIGCIMIDSQQHVLARTYNSPISHNDPTGHAEILAIRQAGAELGNYRLVGTTLYVTLEPCAMCLAAMMHARIERLVFGAFDPKSGAVESAATWVKHPIFNHRLTYESGVLANDCGALLKQFFQARR